nr:hypothetical protein TorRG33x02_270040 [Ipomoea batatas]
MLHTLLCSLHGTKVLEILDGLRNWRAEDVAKHRHHEDSIALHEETDLVELTGGVRRVVFKNWQSFISGVSEGGGDDHDGSGGHERAHHAPADHLALNAGQVHREPGGAGRGRPGEERPGQGQNLEPALQHDGAGSGGLPERHVSDGAVPAEDANAPLPPPRELRYALRHVTPAGDLHHVTPQPVRGVARDENRRFRLVLRPRRPPPRPLCAHFKNRPFSTLIIFFIIIIILSALFIAVAIIVAFANQRELFGE